MTQESLDEKTLTPNELTKREEIVKSLKKKQSDFVKRYGADRAKSVMYAVATKTAKAVTEESLDEGKFIDSLKSNSKKLISKLNAPLDIKGLKELEADIDSRREKERKEQNNLYASKKQIQREHLEQTGVFLSLDEIVLDERIEMPQGHKYTADPISKASENDRGRKKPQMGSKTNTAATVAAILKKTKE